MALSDEDIQPVVRRQKTVDEMFGEVSFCRRCARQRLEGTVP